MANLDLNTVGLTSTLRTAPSNGAPSSSDYNSSQRETLVDLSTLAGFINNVILPLIDALPAASLLPVDAPVGIEGRTIWSDTSDNSTLFFDALSSTPLTIADSIRLVSGIVSNLKQQLIDQGIEVASLQARLASTDQNDIALALQNLSSSLNQLTNNQLTQNIQITELRGSNIVSVRSASTNVPAGSSVNITLTFPTPFPSNFYTVSTSAEVPSGADGLVYAGGFVKNGTGVSVTVGVTNHDVLDRSVIVHVLAQAS